MRKLLGKTAIAALTLAFATEAMATEWNVSLWGKRRAFTENTEKLAELVAEKTNGEFTLNIRNVNCRWRSMNNPPSKRIWPAGTRPC